MDELNTDQYKAVSFLTEVVLTKSYDCKVYFCKEAKDTTECKVCLNSLKGTLITTSCNHTFHRECFMHSLITYKFMRCLECNEPF